jgi:hypothetical protein
MRGMLFARAQRQVSPRIFAGNFRARSALRDRVGRIEGSVQSQFDADFWRGRADKARGLAQAMVDPEAKRNMQFIAEAYERLANHAERTARRNPSRHTP